MAKVGEAVGEALGEALGLIGAAITFSTTIPDAVERGGEVNVYPLGTVHGPPTTVPLFERSDTAPPRAAWSVVVAAYSSAFKGDGNTSCPSPIRVGAPEGHPNR